MQDNNKKSQQSRTSAHTHTKNERWRLVSIIRYSTQAAVSYFFNINVEKRKSNRKQKSNRDRQKWTKNKKCDKTLHYFFVAIEIYSTYIFGVWVDDSCAGVTREKNAEAELSERSLLVSKRRQVTRRQQ